MISDPPEREAACRKHDEYTGDPCPGCGFVREPPPDWARVGAIFALDGRTYRIRIAGASTNRDTPRNLHFRCYVRAERLDSDPWPGLPSAPATKGDVLDALNAAHALPEFTPADLRRALRIA